MVEAWLVYQPRTAQLYYQIGNRAYDAQTLREITLPTEFGLPILQIRDDQKWIHQPVFIQTTNGWAVESTTDDLHFGIIAQSSPAMISEPILNFKVFEIPNLTHANVHADGSESLDPIQYRHKFNPLLVRILQYLKDRRLPQIYDVRNRRLILRAISDEA